MAIKRYKRGTAIRLQNTIRDVDGALYDPSTSVSVELYDADGTEVLSSTAMSTDTTGVYYYDWQSAGGNPTGYYQMVCTSVDGTKTSIEVESEAFYLYA